MILTIVEWLLAKWEAISRQLNKKSLKFTTFKSQDVVVQGDIKMLKMEFNQEAVLTAETFDRRGKAALIEAGTAFWSIAAVDANGEPSEDLLEIVPNVDNELSATVRSFDFEGTAVVTLRADGDPDADEQAEIIATLTVIVDASNATVVNLTATPATDLNETPTPVEEPVPDEPAEETVKF